MSQAFQGLVQRPPLKPAAELSPDEWRKAEIRDSLEKAGVPRNESVTLSATLSVLDANIEASKPIPTTQLSKIADRAISKLPELALAA